MTDKSQLLIYIWEDGKLCEIGAGTEKGQFAFGYGLKILIQEEVYFRQSNISL